MAVLSVETKKISELEAATTLNANSLFVADMPTVGTQKLAYSDFVNNVKDSLQIPRAADAVATSAIATEYTNSQTQVSAASQGYDLNARLSVIERENNCIYGVLPYGIEWTLSDLLAKIRAEKFNEFAIGDYITVNSIKWCIVAKNYWSEREITNFAPHVVLVPIDSLGSYVYNSTDTNAGGYNSSQLKNTIESTVYNALPSALRSACLDVVMNESTKANSARYTRKIRPLNEAQIFGSWMFSTAGGYCCQQFPLCKSLHFLDAATWLIDAYEGNATDFVYWTHSFKQPRYVKASQSNVGIRPQIAIG